MNPGLPLTNVLVRPRRLLAESPPLNSRTYHSGTAPVSPGYAVQTRCRNQIVHGLSSTTPGKRSELHGPIVPDPTDRLKRHWEPPLLHSDTTPSLSRSFMYWQVGFGPRIETKNPAPVLTRPASPATSARFRNTTPSAPSSRHRDCRMSERGRVVWSASCFLTSSRQ